MLDIRTFAGIELGPGTLYSAITRLVENGWIKPQEAQGRQRPYQLTARGLQHLQEQLESMRQFGKTRAEEVAYRMNFRLRLVRGLLRLYPAEWRAEYGEELEALLALRPLTPYVFVDVALSATRERLPREVWSLCGATLFVWTVLGIVVNNTTPLSQQAFDQYRHVWEFVVFLTGCWTALRNRRQSPSWAAAKAAFDMTFPTPPRPGFEWFPIIAAVGLAEACWLVFLGGLAGRGIAFFWPRLRVN